jgi:hypothetical protein
MFQLIEMEAQRKQELIERELAIAAARRQLAPEPAPSFRRAIGRRFIEIGLRLAAEPPLKSVRSR